MAGLLCKSKNMSRQQTPFDKNGTIDVDYDDEGSSQRSDSVRLWNESRASSVMDEDLSEGVSGEHSDTCDTSEPQRQHSKASTDRRWTSTSRRRPLRQTTLHEVKGTPTKSEIVELHKELAAMRSELRRVKSEVGTKRPRSSSSAKRRSKVKTLNKGDIVIDHYKPTGTYKYFVVESQNRAWLDMKFLNDPNSDIIKTRPSCVYLPANKDAIDTTNAIDNRGEKFLKST